MVTKREMMKLVDAKRVEAALGEAEKQTSGEIRVSIAPFFWGDVRHAAEMAFQRLGMTNTKQRNGVLIFVVPSRKKFVVLGDAGIHAKAGQAFWDRIAAAMSAKFHAGDYTGGLVDAIAVVGEELKKDFPHAGEADVNELPNQVDFGH